MGHICYLVRSNELNKTLQSKNNKARISIASFYDYFCTKFGAKFLFIFFTKVCEHFLIVLLT